jgi:hypothetical protein
VVGGLVTELRSRKGRGSRGSRERKAREGEACIGSILDFLV